MHLRVLFFAGLRDQSGTGELAFSSAAPLAVGDLSAELARRYPQLAEGLHSSGVRVAVNEEFVGTNHQLTDGDEVAFIPPVSGG